MTDSYTVTSTASDGIITKPEGHPPVGGAGGKQSDGGELFLVKLVDVVSHTTVKQSGILWI